MKNRASFPLLFEQFISLKILYFASAMHFLTADSRICPKTLTCVERIGSVTSLKVPNKGGVNEPLVAQP